MPSLKPLPPGAAPLSAVTPEMRSWAKALLADASFPMGETRERAFGPVRVVARAEVHDYYGADPARAPSPHRGISLYAVPGAAAANDVVTLAKGVDVSAFQPDLERPQRGQPDIDWPAVAAGGYSFAWIKATEGVTWDSKYYATQFDGAGAVGILRGAYHFFRSTSPPVAQMRKFVEFVREHGPEPEMGWSLDVEWQKASDPLGGLSAPVFADNVVKATRELAELTGRRPVLYSAPGFWSLLPAAARAEVAAMTDLWQATYRATPPPPLDGFPRWLFWQHSDEHHVPGIGPVDANVFAGTLDELRAWARGEQPEMTGDPEQLARLWRLADKLERPTEPIEPTEPE